MYYSMGENGKIECVSDTEFPGAIYTSEAIAMDFDGVFRFKKDMQTDEYKAEKAAFEEADALLRLRNDREIKCFMIVNRGQVWYATLTEEQKQELAEWYQSWLDVTETRVEPETPSWLK